MNRLITYLAVFALAGAAQAKPFEVRGIKGLWWQGIANYDKALPWLAEHKLNFLMLCYSSFAASGSDWRSEYTPAEKEQIAALAAKGRKLGVEVCLSFNPGIWSKPPLEYSSDGDYKIALDKVKTIHALGVRWFGLCLDDINRELTPADKERFGTLQAAQVYFVNRLWRNMRALRPRPKLIFCPSAYLTADAVRHQDYINTIGEGIDGGVMMFWTGPACCSSSITAADARTFGKWIRRKPFVWDNYPVNDMYHWRPLVGPLKNRSADLAEAVSGYIANPMKQWSISTIPLTTTALYLNDPAGYDPQKAIEAAISSFPKEDQPAIRLLVELYGSSFWGEPGFPPGPKPGGPNAAKTLGRARVLARMLRESPSLAAVWEDVRPGLEEDIRLMERKMADRMVTSPLLAYGDEFEGGAGSVFGYMLYGRSVNYVYAVPTGRNEMRADFRLDSVPSAGAMLKIIGRNGDASPKARIDIEMNGRKIVSGEALFGSEGFEEKSFDLPADSLIAGRNTLTIRNVEPEGTLGMPPWFMVAQAEIALRQAQDAHVECGGLTPLSADSGGSTPLSGAGPNTSERQATGMLGGLVTGTGCSPLRGLANARDSRSKRVSSYDVKGGNADARQIKPGETLTLADIKGAGCIDHIWFTIWHEDPLYLRKMVLRMYWDGETNPSVECPVGDFFGVGHAKVKQYMALAMNEVVDPKPDTREGAMNFFFPMPFARGAKITMTNESDGRCKAMYYYIDYEEFDQLGSDALRFHAWWNRERDTGGPGAEEEGKLKNLDGKDNYVIVDAEGRGHYVGCNVSIDSQEPGWPGEGDDMIFIDGEGWPPSLHGTGTEDYFCSAWGFPSGPYSGPYHGVSYIEDPVHYTGKMTVYRHHIEDPIVFHKSIRVTIEHRHGNAGRDDWSSVGYWYQTEPHKPFPKMLPAAERLPR